MVILAKSHVCLFHPVVLGSKNTPFSLCFNHVTHPLFCHSPNPKYQNTFHSLPWPTLLSTDPPNHNKLQIGTWKSGVSIVHTGIRHPSSVMKNVIPIVMAGGTSNSFWCVVCSASYLLASKCYLNHLRILTDPVSAFVTHSHWYLRTHCRGHSSTIHYGTLQFPRVLLQCLHRPSPSVCWALYGSLWSRRGYLYWCRGRLRNSSGRIPCLPNYPLSQCFRKGRICNGSRC